MILIVVVATRVAPISRANDVLTSVEPLEPWGLSVRRFGVLDRPMKPLGAGTTKKIRGAMLGKRQLDATRFPEIGAELLAIRPGSRVLGTITFDHVAEIEPCVVIK